MAAELRCVTVHIDTGRWRETVLDAVDLAVPAGQITAVLGGPGSGKSMLARVLAGQLPTTARCSGKILIGGELFEDQHRPYLPEHVGYVPQDGVAAFDPEKTVGAQLCALHERHRAWSVERACAAAHYPAEALPLLPRHNSGGQVQRAALAAALLAAPRVLVADGPTNSLDTGTAYQVWKSLRDYADSGAAVAVISNEVKMMITHGFADRLVMMHDGRIRSAGSTAQLLDSDPYLQALLRAS
ncbi:ATP-binding cassette domain-containing protein [Nocardia otitidiscaviarum]|uniref:ATP-binding cassette domain-containing protein n=1 Tax=Nocardia otitidiscaviarum TaxID=1823 RepID=UPI001895A162|nr:ATP-binding cassette domain-containing protein [Nocardia otitidiscaviarum]MBF6236196.1 ATP-binding cassette domain-containing protein [Nocardia otitidiscaviarum]